MAAIYLIRHGRSDSSDCNVDAPLSDEGRAQARLLGERMRMYKIDVLYSSNLRRAVETAQIAFSYDKKLIENIRVRPQIAELDFGGLTGLEDKKVKEFYEKYYSEQIEAFKSARLKKSGAKDAVRKFLDGVFVPPEEMRYPDGEDGTMAFERAIPVIGEWIKGGEKNIAAVCHGGIIRTIICALFGGGLERRLMFGTALENCSITQMHYDEEKKGFFLDRFNDYAHLEKEGLALRNETQRATLS